MKKYSNNKNVLMLLSLLKQHNVKKIIASPGTTNIAVVGSMQHDNYFEMYSAVDERSAAYMACGLSYESGEPVAIICTGATASRNYLPGLTEAYYKKLPILVIAGSHGEEYIGHLHSQVIDRTRTPKDTIVYSAYINSISNKHTEWYNRVEINKCLIKLKQHGGGPVLININASAHETFGTEELPKTKAIFLHTYVDALPVLPQGRIAIFIGSHKPFSQKLQTLIDEFCFSNNAVVFCDHTSAYHGKYRVNFTLVNGQVNYTNELLNVDLLIHLGEVSGDTYTTSKLNPKEVWRVSTDGEIRDLFYKLVHVFEMEEEFFFSQYTINNRGNNSYFDACSKLYTQVYDSLPELNFGNIYIAKTIAPKLPSGCVIHFGIYNTFRTWNMFKIDASIETNCNVGGFGIDGACSTLLGASLANCQKLHFLCVGDLAFFYDINAIGNRHVGNNIRILLINNGRGVEFRKKDHPGYRFGMEADLYMAAAGHYGAQSVDLVKHFSTDLGFEYMSASNKEEFLNVLSRFIDPKISEKPMLFEVFINYEDDVENLDNLRHTMHDNRDIKNKIEDTARQIIKKYLLR